MSSRGLGKGLSALISERNESAQSAQALPRDAAAELRGEEITSLPINKLKAGRYQPRAHFSDEALDELAESIRANGIVLPLLVRKQGEQYEIIAGERRFRAAKRAQMTEVPVIIKQLDDQKTLEIALIENVQRQDLGPLEEADGYQRLIEEFDYTQQALSDAIGKKRTTITNMLRLLNLPEPVKEMLNQKQLTRGHAKVLLTAEDPALLAHEVVKKQLNVRQTEALVESASAEKKGAKGKSKRTGEPEASALVKKIGDKIGLKMAIQGRGEKGKLVIQYTSLQELNSILKRLENVSTP